VKIFNNNNVVYYKLIQSTINSVCEFLGAVMAARNFLNPVSISRQIMEKSPHCALTGEGALEFAKENNFKVTPHDESPFQENTRRALKF
jgi:isoaspartyl peptidase/L-asparaginase-like protein (Ntn-hydrolase superfamily)